MDFWCVTWNFNLKKTYLFWRRALAKAQLFARTLKFFFFFCFFVDVHLVCLLFKVVGKSVDQCRTCILRFGVFITAVFGSFGPTCAVTKTAIRVGITNTRSIRATIAIGRRTRHGFLTSEKSNSDGYLCNSGEK